MDAVELARQSAASLHARAVDAGVDPWRPYEFAVAEARRRDFDVEAAAPGAAVLRGARAALLPGEQLILHEDTGTPFERAFLIAHEIGHAELGDGAQEELDVEVDPARPSEPSPVGIDRVVDYGRRQRREVQMDLFAREFLLPRTVVRQLHLDEGWSASDIARRMGAPFEVVAQQLFDALLLPPSVARTEAVSAASGEDPGQEAAARHRGAAYLLEAGPGTGKTRTLVRRVEGLLDEGVDPRRILLLTFSNKAAAEMAERIARVCKGAAAAAMWIGTFHAFGLDLIRRFHTELGLPRDPRMMDRTEAVELLEREFPRLALVQYRNVYDPTQVVADLLAAISRAKDEVIDPAAYAALGAAMLGRAGTEDEREAAERACEVARVYDAYEVLKVRAARVDFGDLVYLPVRLLEGDAAIRAHVRSRYDHVLVDEYQDVNRSSVRLLAALCGDGANLWAVGDARQSIYRFRGASSFSMKRFGTLDFPGGVRGRLARNYRSTEEVVGAFTAFAAGMKVGAGGGLEADRGAGGHRPTLRTVDLPGHQTVAIAEAIEQMRAEGHPYRDQVVLCTGNEKLSRLGHDLERLGIPVLFLGSLFERPEVKALLAFLSLLTDRRAMGLVGVASGPDFPMTLGDVAAVLDHLRDSDTARAVASWRNDPGAIPGLSPDGRATLTALARALDGFDRDDRPWTVLATLLLDRTRMAARIASASGTAERTRGIAIWQLLNFVRTQPPDAGLPIARLLDRVRRLARLGDDRDLRQLPTTAQGIDAVRLMTIHGAKGLEFPVVHLTDLNADTLPRTPPSPTCPPPDGMVEGGQGDALAVFRAEQAEEQECLFYVALSRARDRLLLYAPTRKSNGQGRALSPFVERLGARLARRHEAPARALTPSVDEAVDFAVEGALAFSESQLELYEACPRRFFYTHLLRVGGRRTASPHAQMHEAVRFVVHGIAGGDDLAGDPAALEQRIDAALAAQGMGAHGYLDDYRALALAMVGYFLSIRRGHRTEAAEDMVLAFGADRVVVRPDEALVHPDGRRTLRRIRTGHRRSSEEKEIGAAAFVLAARRALPGAAVEFVHLADQTVRPVSLSERELQNREAKVAGFLEEIRRGRFPADPSPRTCPGCPAYFICGPLPRGPFKKKV